MSEPLIAELVEISTPEVAEPSSRRDLDMALAATGAMVLVFIMLSAGFGGGLEPADFSSSELNWWEVPIQERWKLDLNLTSWRSQLPVDGRFEILPLTEHLVDVELPLEERDAGFPEQPQMHLSLWLPDVPNGVKVPVIATVHPYYDFGAPGDKSTPNTVPDMGVGKWIYEEFVPHGYALAQVSTFGTGKSTHCQDVKGRGEQIGIDAAVRWLGEQTWSNGNVGLMGKSYAGTTNWEAAQFDNPHLKTIVPISGSIGVQQMFYRNGSSESRALLYDVLYEGATVDGDFSDMRMCSDDLIGPASPWTTYTAAELGGSQWNDYWEERYHLPDVLSNHRGSVYIVWGMQDWNVDPYHFSPTYQLLRDRGMTVRGIYGQWAHNYPDQIQTHSSLGSGYGAEAFPNMTRMDWAIEVFAWFEHFLKGIGPEPVSLVQIQRNDGRWHLEETWPPKDLEWRLIGLDEFQSNGQRVSTTSSVTLESEPFTEDVHISGLPTLHLNVQALCKGGQVFATMKDGTTGLRLGHAVMDLRYRDGGYDAKITIPFISYKMKMEFNPMDVIVPAGHSLLIELTETGEDYLPSPDCASTGMNVDTDSSSVLGLPLIDRPEGDVQWFRVPGPVDPNNLSMTGV